MNRNDEYEWMFMVTLDTEILSMPQDETNST